MFCSIAYSKLKVKVFIFNGYLFHVPLYLITSKPFLRRIFYFTALYALYFRKHKT